MNRLTRIWREWVIIVALTVPSSLPAADTNSLPTFDSLLRHVFQRAEDEGDNDRAFDAHYRYTRSKVTEFRNSAGQLKKREASLTVHIPTSGAGRIKPAPDSAVASKPDPKDGAVSDTHSNVRGQQIRKSDILLNEDLVSRFQFAIVGRELLNGRLAYVVDFVPANRKLPERNLKERFVNKAAGRIWIDAADYSLVKADLHLTQPVTVAWGLAGAIWTFHYSFERERTTDGFWYPRTVDWHLEGREVVVDRIVDYHETTRALQKVKQLSAVPPFPATDASRP